MDDFCLNWVSRLPKKNLRSSRWIVSVGCSDNEKGLRLQSHDPTDTIRDNHYNVVYIGASHISKYPFRYMFVRDIIAGVPQNSEYPATKMVLK